ncbi:NAD(P)/FAD-dependent oxidoreductase [Kocuria sp. M1R5S2]|uniref:NAD(P)/FAD-dependent oxidoreductase n=1 Tax=Kocuria rhizosphaerae TaxID=3376285 RepID=UPI0037AB671A
MTTQTLCPPASAAASDRHLVIVGAGVTGLVTAVRCVLAGHDVTLLDRGSIPDPRSTSFDQHRVLRALDPTDAGRTRRAAGLWRHWAGLESVLCGESSQFLRTVGFLTSCHEDLFGKAETTAVQAGLAFRTVEPDEFPHFGFPAGTRGILEADAGVLLADQALVAAATWLSAQPRAHLRPGTEITEVDPVTGCVSGPDGVVARGDLTLVACGPWSGDLVGVPTVAHRQTTACLRPPTELRTWWRSAPAAGRLGHDGRAWLVPPVGNTSLKISTDAVRRDIATMALEPTEDESSWCEKILGSGVVRDVADYDVIAVRRCHYTTSVHSDTLGLVRLGSRTWARVASGPDGFRTAPLVAERVLHALQPLSRARTERKTT